MSWQILLSTATRSATSLGEPYRFEPIACLAAMRGRRSLIGVAQQLALQGGLEGELPGGRQGPGSSTILEGSNLAANEYSDTRVFWG
jgi:hypothetical protein